MPRARHHFTGVSQRDRAHSKSTICRVLGGVSRSGLHHAHQRGARPVCDLRTETVFKAVFAEHQQTYGSRRMRCALTKHGLALGRYKICKYAEETQDGVQHEPKRKLLGKPAQCSFASRTQESAVRHNSPMECFFLNLKMERVGVETTPTKKKRTGM